MLRIQGLNVGAPDGPLGRRAFLQIGALGGFALTLPDYLRANSSQKTESAVILLWMAGGPSQFETYDPKPDAEEKVRGPFGTVATSLPGVRFCDGLPKQANLAHRMAVIRSITHDLSVHDDASHWMQTGYPLLQARQRGQQNPAQGAVVSQIRGSNQPGLPPYVCIPEDYHTHAGFYQTSAFLGRSYNAVNSGADRKLGNYNGPDFALPGEMTLSRVDNRKTLLASLEACQRELDRRADLSDVDGVRRQAYDLVLGAKARQAFDLDREAPGLRQRYGQHAYGQGALLARRLVEAGVTFVTLNLYEKDVDWWDDHYTIEKNLRKRLPMFDQALATLLEDLAERGLRDRVLVVACGEFGRSPRIDSYLGRGHWPKAMSVVLSGGGIREGQVIGSTNSIGGEPIDRPLGPADLLASIYQFLGVSPDTMLSDRTNRPVPLLPTGEPIRELFG